MDKNYQAAAQAIYNNPRYKALEKSAFPELGSSNASTNVSPNAPAVGTVKNGYKFNGGDPNNKSNWEKV